MGLIAHPGQIASISVDYQGQYAFTCGGSDLTVNQWLIDPQPVANASVMGGGGIEPFVKLLDGGEDGAFFCDMKEGFFSGSCRLVIFINWKSGVAIVITTTLTIMLIYTLSYTHTLPILPIVTSTKETAIALFPRQRCATQQFSMPGLFLLLADQISGWKHDQGSCVRWYDPGGRDPSPDVCLGILPNAAGDHQHDQRSEILQVRGNQWLGQLWPPAETVLMFPMFGNLISAAHMTHIRIFHETRNQLVIWFLYDSNPPDSWDLHVFHVFSRSKKSEQNGFSCRGEYVDRIGFDDLVKLYVNHRPVFAVGPEQIKQVGWG